ncbi:hypothetical protein HYS00_00485 [Candidatus Microgenomates bacterium]|nr:hypothetical protein [Candidatus Microgenomates bacterium]
MRTCVLIFVLFLLAIAVPRHTRAVWIDGYYPGWTQDRLKPSDIDYSALTHVIHFSVVPRANGTLDTDINGIGSNVTQTVNAVHTAGKKIILSIGGANSSGNFSMMVLISTGNPSPYLKRNYLVRLSPTLKPR